MLWRYQNGTKWRVILQELGPGGGRLRSIIRWARLGVWRLWARLKEWHAVATRYEKTAASFMASSASLPHSTTSSEDRP